MKSQCEQLKPLLSEYIDETLDVGRIRLVELHMAACSHCSELVENLRANKARLASLPLRQTSSGFDAALAQRIAALSAAKARRSWLQVLADRFHGALQPSVRPALVGLAAAALMVGVVIHGIGPRPHAALPALDETAFVAQCVTQHRSYLETQPLADWSAQGLAGQTETAGDDSSDGSQLLDETL